eukprot:scaffold55313_cov77-Cyclotella_meneghiniana.AAC.2
MKPAASPGPGNKTTTANGATITPEPCKKQRTKKKSIDGPFRFLVQRKSGVKYLSDMNSPSSIFAAISKYNSISDALHNQNNDLHTTIFQYFGDCHTFRKEFEFNVSKLTSSYFERRLTTSESVVEKSFHLSVRHICNQECFLRAYGPIREYAITWRDLLVGQSDLTKGQVLNEWICQLALPSMINSLEGKKRKGSKRNLDETHVNPGQEEPSKQKALNMFVSFKGEGLDKRIKLERHLNNRYVHSPESFQSTQATAISQISPLSELIASINPLFSPLGLLEELFTTNPWKLLVSTILLNKTQRAQVDSIFFQFLEKWPDAHSTSLADPDDIFAVISPLGLGNKRSKSLVRFSLEYMNLIDSKRSSHSDDSKIDFNLTKEEIISLHQCGEYSWTAYQLFILKELPDGDEFEVCDHALKLYVEYKLGECQQSLSVQNHMAREADVCTGEKDACRKRKRSKSQNNESSNKFSKTSHNLKSSES